MEIKLNKELQKKLDIFLANKNKKMQGLLKVLNLKYFTFSKEEMRLIETAYNQKEIPYDYIYIYIGEAVINISKGWWSIGKFKKDESYGHPIVLGWGIDNASPRIFPDDWIYRIEKCLSGEILENMFSRLARYIHHK